MLKSFLSSFLFLSISLGLATAAFAQEDDGIYGDIYEAPKIEQEPLDTGSSPLDGYSTVDDYYPEGGHTQQQEKPYSEQYVDENGNNVTNNYYGDYYEDDNDYFYASRIRRFHRPNAAAWGYYDPWYTNMYYYTYDPFYWGTSIYMGYWPSYSWGYSSWGWGWNYGFGYSSPYYMPACYGGYVGFGYGYGYGGNYWNGYNHGYNNGFNNGVAYGGYYNTYDSNSGIYYGHRGSGSSTGSSLGSGYRNGSFATVYNKAAQEGRVMHANKENILHTADARPVKGNLDGYQTRSTGVKTESARQTQNAVNGALTPDRTKTSVTKENARTPLTTDGANKYQRGADQRVTETPQRNTSVTIDRSRYRATTVEPRTRPSSAERTNTYQRGNDAHKYSNGIQPNRSGDDRGNMYRDMQRTQPEMNNNQNRFDQLQRNDQYTRPSNVPRNSYEQPQRNVNPGYEPARPSRGTAQPMRNQEQPSRNMAPSRNQQQPSRNMSPAPAPSQQNFRAPSPSRSSGSSAPSRNSGSPARGGRP